MMTDKAPKRFLMVSPMVDFGPFLPVNVSALLAVLENDGFEVKLFDTTFYKHQKPEKNSGKDEFVAVGTFKPVDWTGYGMDNLKEDYVGDFQKLLQEFDPDYIGVSIFTSFNASLAYELIDAIGDHRAKVTVGGMHTYIMLDEVKLIDRIDVIFSGETDQVILPALEFLENRKPGENKDLAGFQYRDEKGDWIDSNASGITNIETIPYLNWDHYDDRNFYRPFNGEIYRMGHVEMARGCPFRCTYCINEYFHKAYPNSKPYQKSEGTAPSQRGYWRLKSPERFLSEVEYLADRHKVEAVKIWDDDFLAMRESHLIAVSEGMKNLGLKFLCHSRPEHMSEEKIKIVAENGCLQIGVGVEAGNPEYRAKYLGRKMENQTVIDAFQNCKKHGVVGSAYCMIGMPDESREDILMTARLLREAEPSVVVHAIFTPYPGNSLADLAAEKGYINKNELDLSQMFKCQLTMPSISQLGVEQLYRTFVLYCNFPDSEYERIRLAETDDQMFLELMEEFRVNESLKQLSAVARPSLAAVARGHVSTSK